MWHLGSTEVQCWGLPFRCYSAQKKARRESREFIRDVKEQVEWGQPQHDDGLAHEEFFLLFVHPPTLDMGIPLRPSSQSTASSRQSRQHQHHSFSTVTVPLHTPHAWAWGPCPSGWGRPGQCSSLSATSRCPGPPEDDQVGTVLGPAGEDWARFCRRIHRNWRENCSEKALLWFSHCIGCSTPDSHIQNKWPQSVDNSSMTESYHAINVCVCEVEVTTYKETSRGSTESRCLWDQGRFGRVQLDSTRAKWPMTIKIHQWDNDSDDQLWSTDDGHITVLIDSRGLSAARSARSQSALCTIGFTLSYCSSKIFRFQGKSWGVVVTAEVILTSPSTQQLCGLHFLQPQALLMP